MNDLSLRICLCELARRSGDVHVATSRMFNHSLALEHDPLVDLRKGQRRALPWKFKPVSRIG